MTIAIGHATDDYEDENVWLDYDAEDIAYLIGGAPLPMSEPLDE